MAHLHDATLTPTKRELLDAWLPSRAWAAGFPRLAPFASFRLDDPAGEVGIEGILLRSEDGVTVHVPLTYRAAPLPGAEEHLLGTTEHSVLGTRWVYDATGDPIFQAVMTSTILDGGTGAEEWFEVEGVRVTRKPKVAVIGSGGTAGESSEVLVVHRVGADAGGDPALTGTWEGGTGVLAVVRSAGSR